MLTTWAMGPVPSFVRRVCGHGASRLVPGARDITRLRPALRPADRAARFAGKRSDRVSGLVAPESKRARDFAAERAPWWSGCGDRHQGYLTFPAARAFPAPVLRGRPPLVCPADPPSSLKPQQSCPRLENLFSCVVTPRPEGGNYTRYSITARIDVPRASHAPAVRDLTANRRIVAVCYPRVNVPKLRELAVCRRACCDNAPKVSQMSRFALFT
jgi:hypothetical protein